MTDFVLGKFVEFVAVVLSYASNGEWKTNPIICEASVVPKRYPTKWFCSRNAVRCVNELPSANLNCRLLFPTWLLTSNAFYW
jgi:hypothetical protein